MNTPLKAFKTICEACQSDVKNLETAFSNNRFCHSVISWVQIKDTKDIVTKTEAISCKCSHLF